MFDHFVWSVVVTPLLVLAAARLLSERLRPGPAAVVLAWSMAVAAGAGLVNVAAFAVKAAAETPAVARRLDFSDQVVRQDTAHVPWVSWLSLLMLAVAGVALVRLARRHRRTQAALRRYAELPALAGGQLVVLDDARVDAFAVPGPPDRIVVTTGMRAVLDDAHFAALLAHERAHLAGRHHRLIRLTQFAAAAHPVFWWEMRRIEYLVERDADERAAVDVGSRRVVARAIGAAALAASGRPGRADVLRLTPAESDVARAGAVPRRVASLLRDRSGSRSRLMAAVPALLAAGSVVWTGECVYDLHELMRSARIRIG
ncbi:Protease HtpX [Micromonospora sp. MW-13]|uniref:M56 family metallopeptidase n=1 Tax=unclassified Micromonospora TaxID=2617518 RepID=UPI000E44C7BD|nr:MULTISPECIES: M56 family metallopeptidase [unclassified Micromonospora]MCX4471748.1 M56 family metallopeptidase [Micromonospora sp. NBC_01655]RGC66982.1 Protease HtpX [Micromonospora sp. MW-13]